MAEFFGTLAIADIDDGGTANTAENVYYLFVFCIRSPNYISQIITVIRHFKDILLLEQQAVLNIGHNFWCGGGCESQNGDVFALFGEGLPDVTDTEVGGSEIVSPLRDTMCLIDRNESDGKVAEPFAELFAFQAFGGAV